MSSSETLLIFAHSGEAQTFIKKDHLQQKSPGFYIGDEYRLLIIGGEGARTPEKTLFTVTRILALEDFSQIVNLGIAGGLSKDIRLDEVYSIATAYAYREGKPVFDSFTLKTPPGPRTSKIRDCLTVPSPVSHPRSRERLSALADIVDMELWWIAYAVNTMHNPDKDKVSLQSVKCISDNTHFSKRRIQAQSEFYSEKLYEHYWEYLSRKPSHSKRVFHNREKEKPNLEVKNQIIATLQLTHVTISQKKTLDSLVSHLIKKYSKKIPELLTTPQDQALEKLLQLSEIPNKLPPKKKTTATIEKLREFLFPISQDYHHRLRKIKKLAIANGIELNYDSQLESSKITATFTAATLKEWEKKSIALESIPAKDIFSILNGETDQGNV